MNTENLMARNWTLDDARAMTLAALDAGNMPRVHPNGFIQLDLDQQTQGWEKKKGHSGGNIRLHVWNPPGFEIPHQDSTNEIHDHVFDMRSTVLRGRLLQKLNWFVVGGEERTHELYRAVYDQKSSSRLEPLGVYGMIHRYSTDVLVAGEQYVQPAFTLHDTGVGSECVVTIMEKVAIHDGIPTIVCEIDNPPDNDFDRATAAPVDYLISALGSIFT